VFGAAAVGFAFVANTLGGTVVQVNCFLFAILFLSNRVIILWSVNLTRIPEMTDTNVLSPQVTVHFLILAICEGQMNQN